jgi:hypothetical protein
VYSTIDEGTESSMFHGVTSDLPFLLASVSQVSIANVDNGLSVSFDDANVQVTTGMKATLSAWQITVDKMDTLTLSGTSEAASVGQEELSVTNAVFDTKCRQNPVAGSATLKSLSLSTPEQATIAFHATCDGQVDVTDARGTHAVSLTPH